MRNLKLLDSLHCQQDQAKNTCCISIDCDTGQVYCATDKELLGIDPETGEVTAVVSLVDEDYLPKDGSAHVVSLQYLLDQQALCVATSNGNLLLWNVTFAQLECVGSVDSGITAMQWSPDLELLIITTGAGTLILMTREFDPVTETSLYPDKFGEAEFVQVGWGKKETQFHGSEGKSAAVKKSEDVKPVQEWDDRIPRISWRGDGQYFAISTVTPDTGARQVRIWTRECSHHSTSENVDGIEQALSWKPSGSLIATSQRRPNKHDIAFFEKNGLRHGEFTLPFGVKDVKVCEVMWNIDSTVLAIWAEDLADGQNTEPKKAYVQLWTSGNYHWYLKQSLHFVCAENSIAAVQWDPEHAYRMHIMCSSGQYFQYTWSWATSCSFGRTSDDQALVAVIDGAKVLMTPVKLMVVPPPMSSYQLQLPCAVNQVVFATPPNSNDLAVVLVDGRLAVFRFGGENKPSEHIKLDGAGGTGFSKCCPLPCLAGVYSVTGMSNHSAYPLSMSHFTWIDDDIIIFCTIAMTTTQHSVLHRAVIENEELKVRSSINVEGTVYGIACDPDSKKVAIQLVDGCVLQFDPDDMLYPWETETGTQLRFPVPCTQLAVCEIGNECVVLGLTDRYRFYVNETEVASNCTSFSVHDEFLLLTTLTHTCRCISRHTKVKVLPTLSDGKAHPFDESIRGVERGSRIVTSVPNDTKLVLQMPRGNLETVHPRALVLSAVRRHLDHLNYKEAFIIMRKHRINMNLIYDHNPRAFLENVEKFVCQVEAVNHINLFLTDLVEEDVTATMYTAAYHRDITTNTSDSQNKVDTICDAIREALYNIDENKYLLSILTTYVRKSKPELEQALQMVKKLRDCQNDRPQVNAEEVLKYLLFLVDVNEMYDVALGTYDFDLVLMVAEKSHKDPKEYIPFLNQLRRLETDYQRYTIDKHLKRYSKALGHICKCGLERFNECLTLINEHHLHTEALKLYSSGSPEFKEVARSYGDLLSSKRQHEDAAIMYVKSESWDQALESFMACNQWQQVFCMTAQLKYSADQESEIARKVAEELKQRRRHSEAAIVLEQYAQDIEEAIVTLIHGSVWDEALRLMYKYKRTDFIETDLKSQLVESFEQQMASMETMRNDFEKYKTRLGVVRQEKEKARLELLESGGVTNDADADLFSDTSSATGESIQSSRYSAETSQSSIYSKMSGRSLRNQRKASHKKWKLKEGSQYEDCALIAAMAKIITYIDGLRDEIRSLIRVLVRFNYDSKAKELQHTYDSFLTLLDKSIPQIWLDDSDSAEFRPILGPDATANTIALAMQQGRTIQSESEEKLDPVIRIAPVLKKDIKWKLYALES